MGLKARSVLTVGLDRMYRTLGHYRGQTGISSLSQGRKKP